MAPTGCASRSWSVLLGIVVAIGLFANPTYITTALAGLNEWTGDLVFLRRDIPRRWNAAMARMDSELPEAARPLMVGQAAVFHLNHKVAYNTVFNPETIELLAKGKTADELRRGLEAEEAHPRLRRLEGDRAASRAGRIRLLPTSSRATVRTWVAAGVLVAASEDGPGTGVVPGSDRWPISTN